MNQLPPAVIFDMDGVIIDSEPLHEKAQHIVFSRNEIDVPTSVYSDFKGQTEEDVFAFVVREYGNGLHDARRLVAEKHAVYSALMDEMRPIAGALEFISFASASGRRLGLTTSAIRANQQKAFDLFDLQPYFDVVVTAEDVTHPKPHPEPYRVTASRLRMNPGDCLVIEDSLHGVVSARAAGCRVAALTSSFAASALLEAGADFVFDAFEGFRRGLD